MYFDVCIDLCLSDVAGACGTVPALVAEPTYQDFCSMDSAQNNRELELLVCLFHSPLPQGRRVSCSTFTNCRTELVAFDSALLGRSGAGGVPVGFQCLSLFSWKISVQPFSADETAGQAPKSVQCSANQVEI